ncbi:MULTISPECIES: class II fructose-bisphosphatase [unclassified Vibrio]|uniref:Fructose-1,6-bisphosphatase n=1 Tax=Vibrio sp. HB236076 TaxID=3232307 RepID=A0AB39HHW2_9VIBR|nr:class II fructose-bisphosphatase [Vibrio sp. HB161653]MDP5255797.1 class II fructose-bisphosphatase [Vibrio sp. HB161653]
MNRSLALALSHVTEGAALAGYQWLGRGDKNIADGAAVAAMRYLLNHTDIQGEIVIGEGEIDDAPMLYIGEKLGKGGYAVDIAVDPIEGTRMTAMGQSNAIAVLAAAQAGSLLKAPDMYMEKLVVGPQAKEAIDLDLDVMTNLANVAAALDKPLSQLTVVTLAKPRHDDIIKQMHQAGIRVYALPDGDVAASILTCLPESQVDVMYCIGGAPEGVISAAVIKALGGNMQAKLLPRDQVKGDSDENRAIAQQEVARCLEMGVEANTRLTLTQMANTENLVFCATGITQGDILAGVQQQGEMITTESLVVDGTQGTITRLKNQHRLATIEQQIATWTAEQAD